MLLPVQASRCVWACQELCRLAAAQCPHCVTAPVWQSQLEGRALEPALPAHPASVCPQTHLHTPTNAQIAHVLILKALK